MLPNIGWPLATILHRFSFVTDFTLIAFIFMLVSYCVSDRSETGFCVDPPDLKKVANDQAVLQSIGKGGR